MNNINSTLMSSSLEFFGSNKNSLFSFIFKNSKRTIELDPSNPYKGLESNINTFDFMIFNNLESNNYNRFINDLENHIFNSKIFNNYRLNRNFISYNIDIKDLNEILTDKLLKILNNENSFFIKESIESNISYNGCQDIFLNEIKLKYDLKGDRFLKEISEEKYKKQIKNESIEQEFK